MALDQFMKIDALKGESKDKVHKDSIDVLAWSWGASNSGTAHVGGGAGAGKVNVQDLSFTKWVDKSSPDLLQACCTGKHFGSATLIVRKAGGTPLEYVKVTLTPAMITAMTTGGSGGEDRLTENITLNFGKVKFEYVEQLANGAKGATPSMAFDVTSNSQD
jgi:type VI secretion system secreted protein Hcp